MRKKKYRVKLIILAAVTVGVSLWSLSSIGISEKSIEINARKEQNIPNDWLVKKDINHGIEALLFFNKELTEYKYSIYQKHKGFLFGYFFVSSGTVSSIDGNQLLDDKIYAIEIENSGRVLIGFNKQRIKQIGLSNKSGEETININSNEPFTIIVPNNNAIIEIRDEYNNCIDQNQINILDRVVY